MISAFYNARSGAIAQEEAMRVISNNLANISTTSFKNEKMGFSELLYSNLNLPEGENDPVRAGNGARSQQVAVDFGVGTPLNTNMPLDFAILGRGFFAIQDAVTEEITYTRDGSFRMLVTDEGNYLTDAKGNYVLDEESLPIMLDEEDASPTADSLKLGVFDFANQFGLMKRGNNQYVETEQSGTAEVIGYEQVKQGYLEGSNVDTSTEMARVIETQRAFQFNSRLIQLADELDQTINNLRR